MISMSRHSANEAYISFRISNKQTVSIDDLLISLCSVRHKNISSDSSRHGSKDALYIHHGSWDEYRYRTQYRLG